MGEVMEVYDLVKKPFNIKFYRNEWKKADEEERDEIKREYNKIVSFGLNIDFLIKIMKINRFRIFC